MFKVINLLVQLRVVCHKCIKKINVCFLEIGLSRQAT